MASYVKRIRKPNFSEKETRKLIELIDIHFSRIYQVGNTLKANQLKKKTWQLIANEVSATSLVRRDEDECRKKWRDLRRAVSSFRTHCRGTGGGPPQTEPIHYDWIMKILGDSVALEGIEVSIPDSWDPITITTKIEDVTTVDINSDSVFTSTSSAAETAICSTDTQSIIIDDKSPPPVEELQDMDMEVGENKKALEKNEVQPHAKLTKSIGNVFMKAKARKQAATKAGLDGDPNLWNKWLNVQIEYYQVKTELAKEKLLKLRGQHSEF